MFDGGFKTFCLVAVTSNDYGDNEFHLEWINEKTFISAFIAARCDSIEHTMRLGPAYIRAGTTPTSYPIDPTLAPKCHSNPIYDTGFHTLTSCKGKNVVLERDGKPGDLIFNATEMRLFQSPNLLVL